MLQFLLATGGKLPESLEFLHWGWWVVHVAGLVLMFCIGCACGKKCGQKCAQAPPAAPAEPPESTESAEGE